MPFLAISLSFGFTIRRASLSALSPSEIYGTITALQRCRGRILLACKCRTGMGVTIPKKKAPNGPNPHFRQSHVNPLSAVARGKRCNASQGRSERVRRRAGQGPPRSRSGARPGPRWSTQRCRSRRGFCGRLWFRAAHSDQTEPVPVVSGLPPPGPVRGESCKHSGVAAIHTGEAVPGCCPTGQAPRCGLGRARCPHCLRRVP